MGELDGTTVAILVAPGVEGGEARELRDQLRARGAQVVLVSPDGGTVPVRGGGEPLRVELSLGELEPLVLDAVAILGGIGAEDALRGDERVVRLVRALRDAGKLVAASDLGLRLLIEAGAAEGASLAGPASPRTDVENGGGVLVEEESHEDGALVTARSPGARPSLAERLIQALAAGAPTPSGRTQELLDELGDESFPASDPPATTGLG